MREAGMKGLKQAALSGALVLAAGFVPASTAHGQSREPVIRAFEVARGLRLGVYVHDVDATDAKDAKQPKSGVVVDTVEPGGPADKAGVKVGDAITEFDGERVRSVRQFSRLVQETPAGRPVAVALSRAGQRTTVTVTPEARSFNDDFSMRLLDLARPAMPPEPPAAPRAPRAPMAAPVPPAAPFERFFSLTTTGRRLGITIESLDEQLAQYFGVKDGVLVKSVTQDSAAQKAGLKAGDVITSINGRQVYEVSDVNRALDRMENADEFTIEIMRDRKAQTIKGKLEARPRSGISMF
jgi:serine protease Do